MDSNKFNQFYVDKLWHSEKKEKLFDKLTALVLGMLFMFSEFGFFDLEFDSQLKIIQFNTEVGDAVKNRVDQILEAGDDSDKEYIKRINKFISENI
ncbi:hypothetical protein [Bacillus thuringiensis]|uniref:hypothetical protein n=1 Tax=Bacillus thuringiensis TaxID=1428 RepID=UPI00077E2235|nr:hypothetical protein [Bacillus thuringiensis]AMR05746.1 hypothetical protein AXW78_26935 [Bacillus thuringiensis]PNK35969.1 hypothetical protein CBR55_22915 [Bacillus thuringiensis]